MDLDGIQHIYIYIGIIYIYYHIYIYIYILCFIWTCFNSTVIAVVHRWCRWTVELLPFWSYTYKWLLRKTWKTREKPMGAKKKKWKPRDVFPCRRGKCNLRVFTGLEHILWCWIQFVLGHTGVIYTVLAQNSRVNHAQKLTCRNLWKLRSPSIIHPYHWGKYGNATFTVSTDHPVTLQRSQPSPQHHQWCRSSSGHVSKRFQVSMGLCWDVGKKIESNSEIVFKSWYEFGDLS